MKPYFRGKDSILKSGIYALLNVATYNKSANSCSLADEFDHIVEKEVKLKHMSLCNQQRFAKLGYSGASILAAPSLRQMLLLETEKDNVFVHV